MRPVICVNPDTNEITALNPLEIVSVNGMGHTFTVYLRDGVKHAFYGRGQTVIEFVALWDAALSITPAPEAVGGEVVS